MEEIEKDSVAIKQPIALKFAPAWKRVISYIIDETLLFLLVSLMFYFAYFPEINYIQKQSNVENLLYDFVVRNQVKFNLVLLIIEFAYYSLLWSSTGQTIGAKILGIAVLHIERKRLSVFQGIAKAFILWGLRYFFYIPLIFVVNQVYQQRLHDFVTLSVVVEVPKLEKENGEE